jgi:hypothetical protein
MQEYPKNLIGTVNEKYYEDHSDYQIPGDVLNFLMTYYLHKSYQDLEEWDKEADIVALDKISHNGWTREEVKGVFIFTKIINDVKIVKKLTEDNYFVGGQIVKLEIQAPTKPVPVSTERFSDLDY